MLAGAQRILRACGRTGGLSLKFDVVRCLGVTIRRPQFGAALRKHFEAVDVLPLAFQQQVARIEAALKTEEAI